MTVPELSDEFADLPDIDRDIFEYCIGAKCRKFNLAREQSAPQNRWIETKGHGKLVQPAPSVVEAFRKCDSIFDSFHGKELRQCNDPIGSVQKLIMKKYPSLDPKGARYFIRMKFLQESEKWMLSWDWKRQKEVLGTSNKVPSFQINLKIKITFTIVTKIIGRDKGQL